MCWTCQALQWFQLSLQTCLYLCTYVYTRIHTCVYEYVNADTCGCYYYTHFAEKEAEALSCSLICPRSHHVREAEVVQWGRSCYVDFKYGEAREPTCPRKAVLGRGPGVETRASVTQGPGWWVPLVWWVVTLLHPHRGSATAPGSLENTPSPGALPHSGFAFT